MKREKHVPLAQYSTFRVGGPADILYRISSQNDLVDAFSDKESDQSPFLCLGGGSNILFSDKGFRGTIMLFENRKIIFHHDTALFECEAGSRIPEIFSYTKKHGYDFSLFSTIPGTIGGATAGNAGLPEGEVKDIFVKAELYDRKEKKFFIADSSFFHFQYRQTSFHEKEFSSRYIIWKVWISLPKAEKSAITEKAKQYLSLRKEKQPWGKTGGSFFKNPKEGAAGYFLEHSGMKGWRHGGAFFSEKHANFMMNDGTATQQDIYELGEIAKQKVKAQWNVELKREVKMIDELGASII